MEKRVPGFLIAVEGIDGSGKSTLVRAVADTLGNCGHTVVQTREPGGTPFGKHLRQILQHGAERPVPEAEFLLFAADRAQHVQTMVIPALSQGNIVISDRMHYSSMAYQGYGRGIDKTMIADVNNWVMQGIEPDLIMYLDVPWQAALQRIQKNRAALSAFESEQQAFFERVVQGFSTMFSAMNNVVVMDGLQMPENISQQAYEAIIRTMEQRR